MVTVDLNADLAEGEALSATDLAILEMVTSASLACGFHAGSRAVMRATAEACLTRGITIGAHVSHRDRAGFGRVPLDRTPSLLVNDIIEQCEVLTQVVHALGGTVSYVKPHGALYNQMGIDSVVAQSVIEALAHQIIPVLVAQAGTVVADLARDAGLRVVFEGFPDRGYRPDGLLTVRGEPGGEVDDPTAVSRRAVSLVCRGGVRAVDGRWTAVKTDTLCIHGDGRNAAEIARAVRSALAAEGVTLRSFLPNDHPGTTARPAP
jgi:UPF0271 protein